MSAAKHLKEHAMLGLVGLNSYLATVGVGGKFSSLDDAIDYRAGISHTTLETKSAAASSGSGYGGREITLSSALTSNFGTRMVLVQIGTTRAPFLARVRNTTSIIAKLPILTSFTNQDITIYDPVFVNIHIMPGTTLDISAQPSFIPSCTIVSSQPGTSLIRTSFTGTSAGLLTMAGYTTLVRMYGLHVATRESVTSQQLVQLATDEMAEFEIVSNKMYHAAADVIYQGDGNIGRLLVSDNDLYGRYDVCRFTQCRQLDFLNNRVTALDYGADFVAAGVAIDTSNTSDASIINIRGNTIRAEAVAADSTAYGIDLRRLGNDTVVNVTGNFIQAYTHDTTGTLSEVVGVGSYTTTATVTPEVNVLGNVFDCRQDGAAAARVNPIHNVNANYVFNRANNMAVSGSSATNGSNTTDKHASLF